MRFKHTPAQIFNPEIPFGGIFELFYEVGWDLCEPTVWVIWCNTVQYSIPIAIKPLMTYNMLTDPYKDKYLLWTMLEWMVEILMTFYAQGGNASKVPQT